MKIVKFKENSFELAGIHVNYRIVDKMINLTDFYRKYNNKKNTNHKVSEFFSFFEIVFDSWWENYTPMKHRTRSDTYCHPYIFIYACKYIDKKIYDIFEISNIHKINELFLNHCKGFYPYSWSRTVTYLVVDLDTGLIKIGKSNKLISRINDLSARWNNISLLFWIDNNIESRLHAIFDKNNAKDNGGVEWFRLGKHQLNMIYDMSINRELNNINILNDIYGTNSWNSFEYLKNQIPFREIVEK